MALPKQYLTFPSPYKRVPRLNRLVHTLAGLLLFPVYWGAAYLVGTPGLAFRSLCASMALRLLKNKGDHVKAYGLLVAPLDSVRYFEFDFMWRAVKNIQINSYLDVSSPRMLPLMIARQRKTLNVDLINPDKKDLPETIALARSFGVERRCRFHDSLIEDAPLEAGTFDLITSMSVIEHIPDDTGAIKAMWSLLKPGGVLLISVPCAAKAWEEYSNLNDYELMGTDESGFVFWQRYYDELQLQERIYSVTGKPRSCRIFAERTAGSYDRNVTRKRTDPYYPYWKEPFMMGVEYGYASEISQLPGMGVIAMEFAKP
ncbi:MAG: methyltransferase domain-containing protein [Pseudomonadota bacterium]